MKTKYHQDNWIPRLNKLAESCGIKLKPIRLYVTGEAFISVEDPEQFSHDSCGRYGEKFVDALEGVRWRCGAIEYGHKTMKMYHLNGWAYIICGDIVHALDRLNIE